MIEAANVVAATGPFQRAIIPAFVPTDAGSCSCIPPHTAIPASCREGAVLVVGAGSSGAQIADELPRAGRRVFLSSASMTGRRGAIAAGISAGGSACWACGTLRPASRRKEHVTIAVSGAYGGHTIDFRRLAARGITLLGRADAFAMG